MAKRRRPAWWERTARPTGTRPQRPRGRSDFGKLLVTAATACGLLALTGCENREVPVAAESRLGTAREGQAIRATIEQITDNPRAFEGQTVTVVGEVGDLLGRRAFTVVDEELLDTDELLVVSRTGFATLTGAPLREDAVVQVTGTVRILVDPEFLPDYEFGYDAESALRFENKPYLVVSGIEAPPRPAAAGPMTDVAQIALQPYPSDLIGRQARIDDVRVQRVVSDQAFWIGPSPLVTLFVHAPAGTQVEPGQTISVEGTLRNVPPLGRVAEEWGLGFAERTALQEKALYLEARRITAGER